MADSKNECKWSLQYFRNRVARKFWGDGSVCPDTGVDVVNYEDKKRNVAFTASRKDGRFTISLPTGETIEFIDEKEWRKACKYISSYWKDNREIFEPDSMVWADPSYTVDGLYLLNGTLMLEYPDGKYLGYWNLSQKELDEVMKIIMA